METTITYEIQFQINDPSYKYAGEWFDQGIGRPTEKEGVGLLAIYRTKYAAHADAYRLVKRTVVYSEASEILAF